MFGLAEDADRVLDVNLYGNAGSGFFVEFPDLADMFENLPAQVLFDKQQDIEAVVIALRSASQSLREDAGG